MKKLIIVEDDKRLGKILAIEFQEKGYETLWVSALTDLPQTSFDYGIVDLRVGNDSGIDIIDLLKNQNPEIGIVILTGHGSIATTVEAMKRGARNYLIKPASIEKIEDAFLGKAVMESETENRTLSQIEHEYIEYVMLQNNNNISKTAKALGLHRQSLQRKLKKLP